VEGISPGGNSYSDAWDELINSSGANFGIPMYTAGDSDKDLLATAYVSYNDGTLCVLVVSDQYTLVTNDRAMWLKIYEIGNSEQDAIDPPGIVIIENSSGGEIGWEGCFSVEPGCYKSVEIHANYDMNGSQTASPGKKGNTISLNLPEQSCPDNGGGGTGDRGSNPDFTATPSWMPSVAPSSKPSDKPSTKPSSTPSENPTTMPTPMPFATSPSVSLVPSPYPSHVPSGAPSSEPSKNPTAEPSRIPTKTPTASPSKEPTDIPSKLPSKMPTSIPSKEPTGIPSKEPSKMPTSIPSKVPTPSPQCVSNGNACSNDPSVCCSGNCGNNQKCTGGGSGG